MFCVSRQSAPNELAHARTKSRSAGIPFAYSVRFRNGPIGVSFDNRFDNQTIVERVLNGLQAHMSDVAAGDILIAIDYHNTTAMSAKQTQKILTTSAWPMVLTFTTPAVDKNFEQKKVESAKKRTFKVTVVYPPTLTGEFDVRLAEWGPTVDIYHEDACPVYVLRPAADLFGCEAPPPGLYAVRQLT